MLEVIGWDFSCRAGSNDRDSPSGPTLVGPRTSRPNTSLTRFTQHAGQPSASCHVEVNNTSHAGQRPFYSFTHVPGRTTKLNVDRFGWTTTGCFCESVIERLRSHQTRNNLGSTLDLDTTFCFLLRTNLFIYLFIFLFPNWVVKSVGCNWMWEIYNNNNNFIKKLCVSSILI